MPNRLPIINSRVIRAILALFFAMSVLAASFARADSDATTQDDVAARDAAVDQVLLLNAVRGADVIQGAVAMRAPDPCSTAGVAGAPPATTSEHTAIIYPAQGSNADISLLYGKEHAQDQDTYAYQFSYEQPLSEKSLAAGLTYLNEGHLADDHRDDYAAQLWSKWDMFGGRLRLGVGAGPDIYYNTATANDPNGYKDSHGVGLLASLEAELELGHGFSLEGRANKLKFSNSFSAPSVLVGIKYELPESASDRALASFSDSGSSVDDDGIPRKYDVSVGGGISILNNLHSESGKAAEVSVSRDLPGPLEATVSYLNEGDDDIFARQGVAVQMGVKHSFANGLVTLHADVGPYFDHVSKLAEGAGDGGKPSPVVALFTYGARFRITKNTGIGISFNRVTTRNSTDSDVLMIQGDWKF